MVEDLFRFLYFLTHPSEYLGLWTLDVTVLFSVLTLLVVLRQLFVAQRQMDIMVRQDETNRELLARRVRLRMYMERPPTAQFHVVCRNDGNKTAQNFYWHLAVGADVGCSVWDPSGRLSIPSTNPVSCEGVECTHYSSLSRDPLYPTRVTPVALVTSNDPKNLRLWWSTVSEDGVDPNPDGTMQRMEIQNPPTPG